MPAWCWANAIRFQPFGLSAKWVLNEALSLVSLTPSSVIDWWTDGPSAAQQKSFSGVLAFCNWIWAGSALVASLVCAVKMPPERGGSDGIRTQLPHAWKTSSHLQACAQTPACFCSAHALCSTERSAFMTTVAQLKEHIRQEAVNKSETD